MLSSVNTVILTQKFNVSQLTNEIEVKPPVPINLKDSEVALANAFLYYSWFNISAANNNNTISYAFPNSVGTMVTYNITFPDGFYSVYDINGFFQGKQYDNGHFLLDANGTEEYYFSITPNSVYYSITLTCASIPSSLPTDYTNPNSLNLAGIGGKCPQLVVGSNNFGALIGFAKSTSYPTTTQTTLYQINSPLVPQISPVSAVNIDCNLVNNTYSRFPRVLYTFSPSVTFGSQINIQPFQLIFLPISDGQYDTIKVRLCDQDGNNLPIIDTSIVVTLLIRKKQK